jgi:hypothetical protein
MRSRLRRFRQSPALVLSGIALFFAIGGIGYAAAKIGTDDIENGAVTKSKLHKNAVTKKKVRKNAINSKKVKDHSLRKRDLAFKAVNGATGPQGPQGPTGATGPQGASGGTSTNATTVNGLSVRKVFFKGSPDTATQNRFSAAGLVLRLGCTVGGDPVAEVFTTRDDIALMGNERGTSGGLGHDVFDSSGIPEASPEDILFGDVYGSGRLTYSTSTGTVLTMLYGFDSSTTFNGEDVCAFWATVTAG